MTKQEPLEARFTYLIHINEPENTDTWWHNLANGYASYTQIDLSFNKPVDAGWVVRCLGPQLFVTAAREIETGMGTWRRTSDIVQLLKAKRGTAAYKYNGQPVRVLDYVLDKPCEELRER